MSPKLNFTPINKRRSGAFSSSPIQNFKDLVNTVEYYGVTLFQNEIILQYERNYDTEGSIAFSTFDEYKTRIKNKSKDT